MDHADRYLNTKSSRYLLRSNQVDRAISTLGLFTKDGDDVERYLSDMQCMWFEAECGEAYFRLGKRGLALKKLTSIDKHFSDIIEDQYDFHTYSLRKMTLRAYIKMLRFEDNVYVHKFYVRGAKDLVKVWKL
jgi:peptide alpha-N-acetyltransferase